MKGTVKWFSKEKGYGFILDDGGNDYFFHVSKIRGTELPNTGDVVKFNSSVGQKGKPAATDVEILSRSSVDARRPYYGKPAHRTETVDPGSSKVGTAAVLGTLGAMVGGPIGGVLGAVIGASIGKDKEEVTRQVEITSPCIKCGGKGQVTSRVDYRTGFQCPTCRSFWKVPDSKLPKKDLEALLKIYPQ